MENLTLKSIITDFLCYFGLEVSKLNFSYDKVPIVQVAGKNELRGLRNIVSEVSKPVSPEHDAIHDQWVEFVLLHIGNLDTSAIFKILKDLNHYLMDKVYFVGNKSGPVDVLIYYLFYNVMLKLTFQEKEKYLHFSRWFKNIQESENARIWRSMVPFSKSLLYA